MLHAVFIPDDQPRYRGQFTGARYELPNGQVVETRHRRTPLYDLARKLEELGFGDWKLQAYTPTGTPSLKGKVSVMAAIELREGRSGLERRKYRPKDLDDASVQRDLGSEGTHPPGNAETPPCESPDTEKAA